MMTIFSKIGLTMLIVITVSMIMWDENRTKGLTFLAALSALLFVFG